MARRKTTDPLRKERKKAQRRVGKQKKSANARAKYGPSGKPSKVVVKSLETGEIIEVVGHWKIADPPKKRSKKRREGRAYAPWLEEQAHVAGYASYADYLESEHWRSLRRQVLDRDGRCCAKCQGRERLQVHHQRYGNLGREDLAVLVTLCGRCHRGIHGA